MSFTHELAIALFAIVAVVSVIAAIGIQRDKVKARRAAYIESAMKRHPAGNRI